MHRFQLLSLFPHPADPAAPGSAPWGRISPILVKARTGPSRAAPGHAPELPVRSTLPTRSKVDLLPARPLPAHVLGPSPCLARLVCSGSGEAQSQLRQKCNAALARLEKSSIRPRTNGAVCLCKSRNKRGAEWWKAAPHKCVSASGAPGACKPQRSPPNAKEGPAATPVPLTHHKSALIF